MPVALRISHRRTRRGLLAALGLACGLAACGGSVNPLDIPPLVANSGGASGTRLSFAYYQRCVNPIFLLRLPIIGTTVSNTCAAAGCHDNANGTGGAFRIIPTAQALDLANSANTPGVIRATDMYKNFYSAQGEVDFNAPLQSRLLVKPLLLGVLHGGGQVFPDQQDPNVRLIQYWIEHPAPQGQDEFSTDPGAGTCSTN